MSMIGSDDRSESIHISNRTRSDLEIGEELSTVGSDSISRNEASFVIRIR